MGIEELTRTIAVYSDVGIEADNLAAPESRCECLLFG